MAYWLVQRRTFFCKVLCVHERVFVIIIYVYNAFYMHIIVVVDICIYNDDNNDENLFD